MATLDRLAGTDDIHLLIAILPADLQNAARRLPSETLMEIVMDLGRPVEARFPDKAVMLVERPIGHEDLAGVLERVGEFTEDNRARIERTLHRIPRFATAKATSSALPCAPDARSSAPSTSCATCWRAGATC